MKMIFKYNDTKRKDYLKAYTFNKLQRLVRKYPFTIKAFITFSKEQGDHEKGKKCSIKLSLPGPRIYASSNEVNFQNAIDSTIKNLKIMLEKRKAILYKSY